MVGWILVTLEPSDLVPLPSQSSGVPWPSDVWPTGSPPPGVDLDPHLAAAFDETGPLATSFAVVVVYGGRLVAERYGGAIPHLDRPDEPVDADTPLLSWSMAKSFLHALVGILVGEGRLALDQPVGPSVAAWSDPADPRYAITLDHLLSMRDGLAFQEDYVDAGVSDTIEMLFGVGKADVAAFAADRSLVEGIRPGEQFNYSSGTTNIVSGIVARAVGAGDAYDRFLHERLLDPIGMGAARATFDEAGTWIASSYLYATARDFARFGLLALRDGMWNGRRILPTGWVDHGRAERSVDPADGMLYGSQWWATGDEYGTFWANGYEGQSIMVCPALDVVVVRMGRTPAERGPSLRVWRSGIIDAFAIGV